MEKILPKRKHPRLKHFDYGQGGLYFVTICTQGRKSIFANILDGAEIQLTEMGIIAENKLKEIGARYNNVCIEKYIIMPNHIHVLIEIKEMVSAGASPRPTLPDVMCAYKSLVTRIINGKYKYGKVFQTSFYEHIIRGKRDYLEIWDYIDNNPYLWEKDKLYVK